VVVRRAVVPTVAIAAVAGGAIAVVTLLTAGGVHESIPTHADDTRAAEADGLGAAARPVGRGSTRGTARIHRPVGRSTVGRSTVGRSTVGADGRTGVHRVPVRPAVERAVGGGTTAGAEHEHRPDERAPETSPPRSRMP